MATDGSRGSAWRTWALAVLSTLTAMLAVDAAARFLFPVPEPGYTVWTFPPGSRVTFVSEPDDFEAVHRYNAHGFRGGDLAAEPRAAVRVACLGDSYTEGLGAAEHEAWPVVLENELRDLDCEILNMGVAGATPQDYGRVLFESAIVLRPSDVIVCLLPSDLRGGPRLPYGPERSRDMFPKAALTNPLAQGRRPIGTLGAYLLPGWTYLVDRVRGRWPVTKGMYWTVWSDEYLQSAIDSVRTHGRVSREEAEASVHEHMKRIEPSVLRACARGRFNPHAVVGALVDPFFVQRVTLSDLGELAEKIEQSTTAWLAWYAHACSSRGIRPWVLYFPEACLVCPGLWGPLQEGEYEETPNVYGDVSVRDLLKRLCEMLGIRFIDATDAFMEHNRERLFLRYDAHPTARSYRLVAGLAATELRRVVAK